MKKTELARKTAQRFLGRNYGYGYAWDWRTVLDASGTEDFNEPEILNYGDTFIDGGAAWGFWTVRAAKFYRKVASFEPDPRMIPLLRSNVRINGLSNVQVFPYALSDVSGEKSAFFKYAMGESSLLREHMGLKNKGEPFEVTLTTIDQVAEYWDLKPSVIKLDVEGAELDVLKGSKKTVKEYRPSIIVEVHYPCEPEQIESLFPDYAWTRRLRYLNTAIYPMKIQTHLLGLP